MAPTIERRKAPRISLSIPVLAEKIGHRELLLHPNLVAVYDRVHPNDENLGLKFSATLNDLSTNGCFISGTPLPLLSRVAIAFTLEGFGSIEALGWVLWRRRAEAEVPLAEQKSTVKLKAGFGVLFEAIPLDARLHIAKKVQEQEEAASA
jgi:hypothetical protein